MNRRFQYVFVTASALLVALLIVGSVLGKSTSPDDPYQHLRVFSEVLTKIKGEYVEEPDLKNVTLGAVNGLLESVDPYASYLNADQYRTYLKSRDQHKAGVGLVLSRRFGYMSVVDTVPGSPAAKIALGTGDIIEAIQGVATRDMPLAYAELLLGGEPGSQVEITILRARRNPEPQKVTLTRAVLKEPGVESKLLADGVGYLAIRGLGAGMVEQAAAAAHGLLKQGAKKLILDVRDNAFGDPAAGIDLAALFVAKGSLGYLQGQKVPRKEFTATNPKVDANLPLVVLTNRGTARAAEVAAAALVETKRAEVVGERTYGYASLQKTVTMEDGSAVILAVAKYYSPSGKSIQDLGVTPTVPVAQADVSLSPDGEDDGAAPEEEAKPKPGDDPILKKALEVLAKGLVAAKDAAPAPDAASGAPKPLRPLNIPANPQHR
jgi:carboxyl-terminal processing protease